MGVDLKFFNKTLLTVPLNYFLMSNVRTLTIINTTVTAVSHSFNSGKTYSHVCGCVGVCVKQCIVY